jgi:hypothetical protein
MAESEPRNAGVGSWVWPGVTEGPSAEALRPGWLRIAACGLLAGSLAAAGFATEVKMLKADTQAAFLAGTLDGVSVDPLGSLRLADRIDRLTAIDEPFVFSAAATADGWVVGTGNSGKVLAVDRKGKVSELFAAPEPEIFAVWADPDGTVFAGSSPDGKVYRITGGAAAPKAEPFFAPGEDYIWAIARGADGALLVATGTQGKLYRVGSDGKGEVVYDGDDTHLRSLLPLPGGGALVGTAGEGLILRLLPDRRVQTLFDASQPEVVSLVADDQGNWYAAVLASEASFVDLTAKPAAKAAEGGEGTGEGEAAAATTTIVVEAGEPAAGSRPAGATGPRSTVFRLLPSGAVETLWSFESETVYSLAWVGGRLWAGTGLDGKLYSFDGSAMVLEADVEERQLVALLAPGRSGVRAPAFVSTNAAALFRPTGEARATGTYTSPALDAGQTARFGTLHWEGDLPAEAEVRFAFRSGLSAEPDATWSPWTPAVGGREIPTGELPPGRYVQWRAELVAGRGAGVEASPRVAVVELSFRQENLRPKIDLFAALDPGQILVPQNFNPASQVFEPVSPDREGMFQTLQQSLGEDPGSRFKPLWKKGFRTLRWRASDPNGDLLRYRLSFRAEGAAGDAWLAMAEELEDPHYGFDSTALPDGLYRFRLEASDERSNPAERSLVAEMVSEAVLVDHSPPQVEKVRREGDRLLVEVRDRWSPIRRAEVAVDGGEWVELQTVDGLLDGRRETLLVSAAAKASFVVLRMMDAAWNVVAVPVEVPR